MFKEIIGDLFDNMKDRIPVHCIASDHAMGAGIAVPMAERFNLRETFNDMGSLPYPSCIYINGVMNMITKEHSGDFPTYENFRKALLDLYDKCLKNNITRLVMPRIGCGIDALDWELVSKMIETELSDLDVLVCTFANPEFTIDEIRTMEKVRKGCLWAKKILELKIGPVVLLGKEFDGNSKPIDNTILFLDKCIKGNGFSVKDKELAKRIIDRAKKNS